MLVFINCHRKKYPGDIRSLQNGNHLENDFFLSPGISLYINLQKLLRNGNLPINLYINLQKLLRNGNLPIQYLEAGKCGFQFFS